MKCLIGIWAVFESLSRKFKFHCNLTTITGTLHADRYAVLIISLSVLLRMRNFSSKICTENQNTHFVFSNFFPPENRAVYEIMCKNNIQSNRTQMTIWRKRTAFWIPKATNK